MTTEDPLELMRSAWAMRRSSFDMPEDEQRRTLEDARAQLGEAAEMLRGDGPSVPYAHAVHLLANVAVDLGEDERALELWEEAVAILRGQDDPLELAHKVRHLGDLHRSRGRLDRAEECYEEALKLYREHDVEGSLSFANALRRMAILRELQGEGETALTLWRETSNLYAAAGVDAGVDEAEQRIGELGG